MPTDVKVTLDDAQLALLNEAFDLGGKAAPEKAADYQAFCKLVVALMTDWIAGKTRYRSLTESNIDIVQKLYEALLPDEPPSAQRLFNKFNLPPGQAAYIARVLSEKDQPKWRALALSELRMAVNQKFDETKDVSNTRDQEIQFEISKGASAQLKTVANDIKKTDGAAFEMPAYESAFGDFWRWKCTVATLRRIKKQLDSK